MTVEELQARLDQITAERAVYIEQATRQIGYFDGAIAVLTELLNTAGDTPGVEAEE